MHWVCGPPPLVGCLSLEVQGSEQKDLQGVTLRRGPGHVAHRSTMIGTPDPLTARDPLRGYAPRAALAWHVQLPLPSIYWIADSRARTRAFPNPSPWQATTRHGQLPFPSLYWIANRAPARALPNATVRRGPAGKAAGKKEKEVDGC